MNELEQQDELGYGGVHVFEMTNPDLGESGKFVLLFDYENVCDRIQQLEKENYNLRVMVDNATAATRFATRAGTFITVDEHERVKREHDHHIMNLQTEIEDMREALLILREPLIVTVFRGEQKLKEFESYEACRPAQDVLRKYKKNEG